MSSLQKFHRRTNGGVALVYDTATKLLLKGDNTNGSTTITDSSVNGYTVTNSNGITNSTTQSKYGNSSIYFSNNKLLSFPTISLTGDFTVEGWFYQTTAVSTYMVFANGSHWFGWDASATGLCISSQKVVSLDLTNSWQHLAFVRSGGVTSIFQNGKFAGTVTCTGTVNLSAIGSYGGSYGFNGYIDELRISDIARYTAEFIPPLSLTALPDTTTDYYPYNVSVLLKSNGTNNSTTFTDNSGIPKTITTYGGAKISTANSKFGGSSAYFSSSNDYLTAPAGTEFDFGTGAFTIECWFNMNALGSSGSYMIFCGGTSSASNICIGISSNKISILGAGGTVYLNGNKTLSNDTWYHLSVVRYNGTLSIYIDGVLDGSVANTTNFVSTATVAWGAYPSALGIWNFGGYIDDFRITKGVARYISTFTPPNELPTPPSNPTLVLLNANGTNGSTSIIDSSPIPKSVTVNGNTQISTAQSKFGGSSIKFDGAGDYLQIPVVTSSADVTYEGWVYYTTNGGNYTLVFDQRAGGGYMFYVQSGNFTVGNNTNGTLIQASMPVAQNTWFHLAIVRNNGYVQVYINGLAVGTRVADATTGLSGTLWIGRFNDGYNGGDYLGYIDDFRVSATAKYVPNFTPPTQLS